MTLKEQHDKLLEEMPEGASHDAESCPICNPTNTHNENDDSNEGGDMKTYTEDEFTAAVNEAVAPLQAEAAAKVAELQTELDALKAVKAAEEAEGQIAEVQAELDKANVLIDELKAKYDDLVSYLNAEENAKAEAAELEVRRADRVAQVKDAAPHLSDERIEARIESWVALDDEEFAALLEDFRAAVTVAREGEVDSSKLAETAMSNVRTDDQSTSSVGADVFGARSRGIDVRYL